MICVFLDNGKLSNFHYFKILYNQFSPTIISSWQLTVVIYPSTQLMEWMIKWEIGAGEVSQSIKCLSYKYEDLAQFQNSCYKKAHSYMNRDNQSQRVINGIRH